MMTIYTDYPTQKELDEADKKREAFSKENNYEFYRWHICWECMNFIVNLRSPRHGGICKLIEQAGAYPGVQAQSVCNKFLSSGGTDINNKPVPSTEIPEWVRRYKSGNKTILKSDLHTCVIKNLIAENLIYLLDASPEKICELLKQYAGNKEEMRS